MTKIIAEQPHDVFYRCVEDCSEPIMITDKKGLLVYINPAWRRTYGYSQEEAIGQTPRLLRSDMQTDSFYQEMWAHILKEGSWRGELVNRAKDGTLVTVMLTITPYRAVESTEILGYMGIAVDITAQKQLEIKVLQQDRLASIGMLSSGLAHEIGTPLGVIRGRAEFLAMQTEDTSIRGGMDIIVKQIDRISKLIHSLLRVSRTPDDVEIRTVELDSILSEVMNLISQNCRQHMIELQVEHPTGLNVRADSNQLQQVLLNLAINSLHAIQSAVVDGIAGPHRLSVTIQKRGGWAEIRVTDTGCGITPLNLKRLFQPFFTTKDVGMGTGLGLAIVAKLMQEMGGRIEASSDGPGKGATFTLWLQLC